MTQHDLKAAVSTHKALVEQIRAMFPTEDEESLADTIEGLTTIDDAILAVMRAALEREAHAEALAGMIATMAARKKRLETGADFMRAAALHAMQECGLKKIPGPDMTLSIGSGRAKLIITEPDKVPDELCKVERTPKKKEIIEWLGQLDAMSQPAWAAWGNPQPFLTVHRK